MLRTNSRNWVVSKNLEDQKKKVFEINKKFYSRFFVKAYLTDFWDFLNRNKHLFLKLSK